MIPSFSAAAISYWSGWNWCECFSFSFSFQFSLAFALSQQKYQTKNDKSQWQHSASFHYLHHIDHIRTLCVFSFYSLFGIIYMYMWFDFFFFGEFLHAVQILLSIIIAIRVAWLTRCVCLHFWSDIVCHCSTRDLLNWLPLAVAYRMTHARRLHYILLLFIHKFWRNVSKAHTIETHSQSCSLIHTHANQFSIFPSL